MKQVGLELDLAAVEEARRLVVVVIRVDAAEAAVGSVEARCTDAFAQVLCMPFAPCICRTQSPAYISTPAPTLVPALLSAQLLIEVHDADVDEILGDEVRFPPQGPTDRPT